VIVDLLVIGGGIHGAAVARDAALRGLSVVLLEAGDLASGTSSRSSKLVHGGIRYLETGQFGLVREALRERAVLLEIAPDYVRPLPFLIPHYAGSRRPRVWIEMGLFLYSVLAGRQELARHGRVGAAKALELEPMLAPDGLRGGSLYWDAQVDDAGLCVALACHAESLGATVSTYHRVVSLRRDGAGWRAGYRDTIENRTGEVAASVVVNAAGPWTDEIRSLARGGIGRASIRRTRGTHIVFPDLPLARALLLTAASDGRVFFALPWERHAVIGTTDVDDAEPPRSVVPTAEEVRYLVRETARVLPGVAGRRPVRTFAGLRSLVRTGARNPWSNPREHRVLIDDRMLTIIGGKYTTHRSLAERVVDGAASWLRPGPPPCRTRTAPVPGGRAAAIEVLRSAHPGSVELPGGMALSEAEVVHAVRAEKARRLEDVLLRRTRLWLDGRALGEAAGRVAAWMTPLLGWSPRRWEDETESVVSPLREEARLLQEVIE
jgi:glycerol-3-phosphate dehydrogenase